MVANNNICYIRVLRGSHKQGRRCNIDQQEQKAFVLANPMEPARTPSSLVKLTSVSKKTLLRACPKVDCLKTYVAHDRVQNCQM